jgi:hypothetical protein
VSSNSIRSKILARSTEARTAFHMKTLSGATTDSTHKPENLAFHKLQPLLLAATKVQTCMEFPKTATGYYSKK